VTERAQIGDLELCRRLAGELLPYWRGIASILLLSFAAAPLSLLTPLPLKIAVDSVIGSQPLPDFLAPVLPNTASKTTLLIAVAALLALVTALTYGFALGTSLLQTYIGERLT
jgi:ATP-binding cassette subfamily B protein